MKTNYKKCKPKSNLRLETQKQGNNTKYVRRWFKQKFILITYENKRYDQKNTQN
jgi:hypothetical protein